MHGAQGKGKQAEREILNQKEVRPARHVGTYY